MLPALDKLARTRHSGADLEAVAAALKQAETNCPGVCDQLLVELLTTVAYPQATESELQAAIDSLTRLLCHSVSMLTKTLSFVMH